MTPVVLDVVLLPSSDVSREAVDLSHRLADQMALDGNPSHFRLGQPLGQSDGGDDVCTPHVSLFMLAVEGGEVPAVNDAVRRLAATLPPVPAVGVEYRHNPQGAPEIYFQKSAAWEALSRAVVAAVEPLRRGRLRVVDPAGERLHDVVNHVSPPDADRVRQLLACGYDEIVDDYSDRFNPHVTLAWPVRSQPRVNLAALPPASTFSHTFDHIALCEMGPWGTCVRTHGTFRLAPAFPRPGSPTRPGCWHGADDSDVRDIVVAEVTERENPRSR